jgi:hypothetical protein
MSYPILNRKLPSMALLCCVTTLTQAHVPVWTLVPLTPTALTLTNMETATIQYKVYNQSIKSHQLAILSKTAALVQTTPCVLSPRGTPGDTCVLSLLVSGRELSASGLKGGPILCQTDVNNHPNPNQCYLPSGGNELDITLVNNGPIVSSYIVTPSTTDGNVTVSPNLPQPISAGGSVSFTVKPTSGYSVSQTVGGTCPAGTFSNNTYTIAAITSSCTVNFSSTSSVFAVAAGPTNVNAVAGNSQATVSWTSPINMGDGKISGYIVSYYSASTLANKTVFSECNPTSGQTCIVTGLSNGNPYGFIVQTVTTYHGNSETGPPSFSDFITPSEITVTPASLALKVNGIQRSIKVTNNQSEPIIIGKLSDFTPSLPSGTMINTRDCEDKTLSKSYSCTIMVTPGNNASTVSSNSYESCNSPYYYYDIPIPSTATLSYAGNNIPISIQVLDKRCKYQGGYIFSIDDTTPTNGSIGGKVFAYPYSPLVSQSFFPPDTTNVVWGIDDSSTTTSPSPNKSSTPSATLMLGQLNCNATQDGACNTQNLVVAYGKNTNYPAGYCKQPLSFSYGKNVCKSSGSVDCYQDWYLPAVCDLGPFDSTSKEGYYPTFDHSLACINPTDNIGSTAASVTITGNFWSSVTSSNDSTKIWQEQIPSQQSSTVSSTIKSQFFCIRNLNY